MKNIINDIIPPKTMIEIHTIKAIIAIHDPFVSPVSVGGGGVVVFVVGLSGTKLSGTNRHLQVQLMIQYSIVD